MSTLPYTAYMEPNYIILDAARLLYRMDEAKELNDKWVSLYNGTPVEDLAEVAPYIFSFEAESEFAKWILTKCWGDACCVLIHSPFSPEVMYEHLQNLLLVKTEHGEELYFRFYDPRILRIFLPTCDRNQLKEFFGPVEQFICEDENADFSLAFYLNEHGLKSELFLKRVT